jgi:hypothetical protein
MITPREAVVSVAAAAVMVLVGLPGPVAAGAGTIRYASPHGSGSSCSATNPCALTTAINHATGAAQVVVRSGNYGSNAHPITQSLTPDDAGLAIHGVAGEARPVIHTSAAYGVELTDRATLSDVRVVSVGKGAAVFVIDGRASHIVAVSSALRGVACEIRTSIVDSVCVATGPESAAVATEARNSGPSTTTINVTVRGVTAEATDPSSVGLLADANTHTTIKTNATNDIIHGGLTDVEASTEATSATAAIALSHSDFDTHRTTGATGHPTVAGTATVSAPPHFVNPTHLDFREKPGSPTIDKGAFDPLGDVDLAGRPRTVGSSPDIGAFEFLRRPAVHHLRIVAVSTHSATFTASVNAQGLVCRVLLVATSGHTRHESRWVRAHNERTPRRVRVTITGLTAGRSYVVHLIAMNAGGARTSDPRTIRTR